MTTASGSVVRAAYGNLESQERSRVADAANSLAKSREIKVWKTRDGQEIPIAEMEDGHLVSAIRFIANKRKARRKPSPNNVMENTLRAEAARRGLDLHEEVPELPPVPTFVRKGIKIIKVQNPAGESDVRGSGQAATSPGA